MKPLSDVTVGIAGLGQIGGSIACALRSRVPDVTSVGCDRDGDLLSRAASDRIVDRTVGSAADLISQSDVVVLALPIGEIPSMLSDHESILREKTLITDTGSLKRNITAEARRLALHNFIGGHPMAGTHRRGAAAWDAALFTDAAYFTCEPEQCTPDAARAMSAFVQSLGATAVPIDPDRHDSLLATTSGLPHILALALRTMLDESVADDAIRKHIQGPSYKGATRVAASDPQLVLDMLWRNRHNLGNALHKLHETLEAVEQSIRDDDKDNFRRMLNLE